ncbi:MAG: hypothetical protein ACR2IF_16435 [Terriglobales bacterium]
MYVECPICDLRYSREPGYFLGAMYISYGLALPIMGGFALLFWWLTEWKWYWLLLAGFLAMLPLAPLTTTFSRVLWIYLDRTVDPE